jgi:hypothetical protein
MLINHPFVLKVVRIAATYRNDKNVRLITAHSHQGLKSTDLAVQLVLQSNYDTFLRIVELANAFSTNYNNFFQ